MRNSIFPLVRVCPAVHTHVRTPMPPAYLGPREATGEGPEHGQGEVNSGPHWRL